MTRVLLDTNVLASGIVGLHTGSTAAPSLILRQWRLDRFDLLISDHVLQELERALATPYFATRLSRGDILDAVRTLRIDGIRVTVTAAVSGVASHPEDDLILAAAVSGGADYLVTGDMKLLDLTTYRGVTILNPRQFLTELAASSRLPDEEP